ncbi:AraC family transcriptional regulator [Streptomyces sp. NPDC093065]|uniref:AraC family transcriptional regulator n=1 Tax=Streptomyces sp. NPDC093065 TaxID=3366021 RepID=UPI00381DFD8A
MIRGASLRGFARLVEELGGVPGEFTARFSIPARALTSGAGLVPITGHDLMLDAAARDLRCPDFGLRLARGQDLGILGLLAPAVQASATVRQALECASRFMFVHSPALSVGVEPDPRGRREVVALTYRKDLNESPYSPQATELGLGLFHRVAVALVGGTAGLRSVELPHPPLSPVSLYTEFFGADVKFGCPTAALRVERRLLDTELRGTDAEARRLAVDRLAAHHTDPETLTATHVRRVLARAVGVGPVTVGRVARLLALHPRTLQRRLAAESTGFAEILEEVRRDLALRHLTTTDLPLCQVAAMAGFADQSGLSHAVRRWEGASPSEVRRRVRGTG